MLRRRPVMRMAATTAVVAGTATAVSGGVARHLGIQGPAADSGRSCTTPAASPEPEVGASGRV